MSVVAHLCGVKDFSVAVVPPSAPRIREIVAAADGALVEPDLPIGNVPLPRDPIDRAVLATIARGAPRELVFERGSGKPRIAKVKEERALDLLVALRAPLPLPGGALFEAAMAVLAERGGDPMPGKDLLREARARKRGGASTKDGAELGKALVRAWTEGLVELTLR